MMAVAKKDHHDDQGNSEKTNKNSLRLGEHPIFLSSRGRTARGRLGYPPLTPRILVASLAWFLCCPNDSFGHLGRVSAWIVPRLGRTPRGTAAIPPRTMTLWKQGSLEECSQQFFGIGAVTVGATENENDGGDVVSGNDGSPQNFEQGLVEKQRVLSQAMSLENEASSQQLVQQHVDNVESGQAFQEEEAHLRHQQAVFDDMAGLFATDDVVPEDVIPNYRRLAKTIISTLVNNAKADAIAVVGKASSDERADGSDASIHSRRGPLRLKLLDVATGTGVLWSFLIQAAEELSLQTVQQDEDGYSAVYLDITAVDLSPAMVSQALRRAAKLLEKDSDNTIQVVQSNILDFDGSMPSPGQGDEGGRGESETLRYDGVIANACWGNFYDPAAVLSHLTKLMRSRSHLTPTEENSHAFGTLFITHPLGSPFVQQLHESDPRTVPHTLPDEWCPSDFVGIPLQLHSLENEKAVKYYCAALQRVRHAILPRMWRIRGPVEHGYGRGSRQLGFPTANLARSCPTLLAALEDETNAFETGVYTGWARLESSTPITSSTDAVKHPSDVIYKTVVNVGYSPTFEGQENPQKIIEAHIIVDESQPTLSDDFYGQILRLQLHSYLRPEIKFASFPALVAQIRADVADTKSLLEEDITLSAFRKDPFLQFDDLNTECWLGLGGGNETVSWEIADTISFLTETR